MYRGGAHPSGDGARFPVDHRPGGAPAMLYREARLPDRWSLHGRRLERHGPVPRFSSMTAVHTTRDPGGTAWKCRRPRGDERWTAGLSHGNAHIFCPNYDGNFEGPRISLASYPCRSGTCLLRDTGRVTSFSPTDGKAFCLPALHEAGGIFRRGAAHALPMCEARADLNEIEPAGDEYVRQCDKDISPSRITRDGNLASS